MSLEACHGDIALHQVVPNYHGQIEPQGIEDWIWEVIRPNGIISWHKEGQVRSSSGVEYI